jgi:hypothetical protein
MSRLGFVLIGCLLLFFSAAQGPAQAQRKELAANGWHEDVGYLAGKDGTMRTLKPGDNVLDMKVKKR